MIRFEASVYHLLGLNIPYTMPHCRHVPDTDPTNHFGRTASVCPINFEGLSPSQAKMIVICDNTASGMQHVAVLESTIEYIKTHNGKRHHLETLLIISPLLTGYGAMNISRSAAEFGLKTVFVCSGYLLGCLLPDRYFSPVLNIPEFAADPDLLPLYQQAFGQMAGKICARGNWTSTFSAPAYSVAASEKELTAAGSSNAGLTNGCAAVTPKVMQKMGLDPRSLIPYSTLDTALSRKINL
jgi:hypothetical protein